MMDKTKKKLIKRTSQSYFTIGLVAMIISMIVLYFSTRYIINDEIEENLEGTAFRIETLLQENGQLISLVPIIQTQKVEKLKDQIIKDTLIFDAQESELKLFKELSKYKNIKGENYKISVRTRIVESEDILLAILGSYAGIFISVLLAQFYFSKRNAGIIWKPFFDNLKAIKEFSVHSNPFIELKESDIQEFSELNEELQSLTNKVIDDYQNLKQFTEDISHEIQTPLAIIQAKIGNLFDENTINEVHFNYLIDIQNNARKLATLNKNLILLAKIENKQFDRDKKINFNEVLKKSIADFEGIHKISIKIKKTNLDQIYMDSYLASVLVDNLISNAIKYTLDDGEIIINAFSNKLEISNSGEKAISEPYKLYNRFYRENKSIKSLGLGLSIVKKVCEIYNYSINYSFKNKQHIFTIDFS